MKITTLGLKKPEETDVVNIQDMNDNMDTIEKELQARPEKTGKMSDMTVEFEQNSSRTNIATGEKASTIMGKIKKWFSDMTVAAFSQVITSNADLMALTRSGYLVDALAVKNQFTDAKSEALSWDPVFAASNGTLSDGLLVNLTDKNGDANKPRIVRNGATTSMPTDCSYGIREVLWSSPNYLICRITGQATDGSSAIWTRHYSNGWEGDWRREATSTGIDWNWIKGKPSEYTPKSHNHDDRYYTENEVDNKLNGKADTGHNHDTRYYTEKEMDNKLEEKADVEHDHDGQYYTKTEIDNNFIKTEIGNTDTYDAVKKIAKIKSSTNIYFNTGIRGWIVNVTEFSDGRIKKNVENSNIKALDKINSVKLHEFDFINEEYGCHTKCGYIAQELIEIFPEAVVDVPQNEMATGYASLYQVNNEKIVPYLVKAIQELSKEIQILKDNTQL